MGYLSRTVRETLPTFQKLSTFGKQRLPALSLKRLRTENGAPPRTVLLLPPHYNSFGILYVLVHSHCYRIFVPVRHKGLTQDLLPNL